MLQSTVDEKERCKVKLFSNSEFTSKQPRAPIVPRAAERCSNRGSNLLQGLKGSGCGESTLAQKLLQKSRAYLTGILLQNKKQNGISPSSLEQ